MTQPILIGLVAAIGSLAVAVLGLIGVLVTTNVNYRLGKRTGDIAEQAADDARAKELAEENAALRKQVGDLWQTCADLRRQVWEKDERLMKLDAEAEAALRAQERAEGGLVVARQTIQDICPPQIPSPKTKP